MGIRWPALAVLAASCGRFGFGASATDGNVGGPGSDAADAADAHAIADGSAADAAPAFGCPPVTVPDSIVISGTTEHATDYSGDFTVVAGALVVVTYGAGSNASQVSDGSGAFSIAIPSGGQGVLLSITASASSYLTTVELPLQPLTASLDEPIDLFNAATLSANYGVGGATEDGALGTVYGYPLDCDGNPLEGATMSFSPAPAKQIYTGPNAENPYDPSVMAITDPFDGVTAFGQPTGPMTVTTSYHGLSFSSAPITVSAGQPVLLVSARSAK